MHSTKRQFALYLILGGILTLCEWAGFYALTFIAQIHYLISSIIMFVAISLLGLFLYKRAIFGRSHLSLGREISAIYAINIFGIALNSVILWLCVEFFGANAMLGKIIASFLVAFYSFFARKRFVYRSQNPKSPLPCGGGLGVGNNSHQISKKGQKNE
ncbi:GtrA family protein [Helicobacter sp. T3_23-1056]